MFLSKIRRSKGTWATEVQVKLPSRCRRKALSLTMRKQVEVFQQEHIRKGFEQTKHIQQSFPRDEMAFHSIPFPCGVLIGDSSKGGVTVDPSAELGKQQDGCR